MPGETSPQTQGRGSSPVLMAQLVRLQRRFACELDGPYSGTVTGWAVAFCPQTPRPSGCSSSSGPRRTSSMSRTTCSPSWTRSTSKRARVPSGRKRRGKSLLLAVVGAEESPRRELPHVKPVQLQVPWEEPSPLAKP